ncbi:molybdopterin converting factor subunit 1 [Thalassotalea aquiviva]|uniref:molybdopterin converting factor subunit 1 n=1 Tax=Thalassotalea aquiviva TaxID=3242415 RepID=UPI00352A6F54
MKLKILFFAAFREQLQHASLDIECPQGATVADLMTQLKTKGDVWQQIFSSDAIMCAVNQNMVDVEQPLFDQDEVAFFPPVTGG